MSEFSIIKRSALHLGLMTAVASASLTSGVMSADPQGGEGKASTTLTLEEIVVTANKRVESAQSVPIAITAFSGDSLERNQLTTLTDLANSTPGLTFNPFGGGQPEIAIRGVGTKEDGAGAGDSTLVMVDGMYFASRTSGNVDIFDLQRVEVLRGPQGTLFGKNSIGGIINYVTRKPDQEFGLKLRQIVGNYGQFDTAGAVNIPINEEIATRITFSRRDFHGYEKRVSNGETIGGDNLFSWRAQTLWEPKSDLSILLL
ncbi:MAG: TonB-dependent receptor [Kordiimonadaceae bacterium]|nr:TonB-dependent receptor [Kordiimonadaceae bacterium]